MIEVTMNPTQASRMRARFSARKRERYKARIAQATASGGFMFLTAVQQNIVQQGIYDTGAYYRSWQLFVNQTTGETTARTMHPAARRHEFGFNGTDSLGRNYATPPRPHVRPAKAQVRKRMFMGIRIAIETEMSK